jgi:hypothetical protein
MPKKIKRQSASGEVGKRLDVPIEVDPSNMTIDGLSKGLDERDRKLALIADASPKCAVCGHPKGRICEVCGN